MNNIEYEALGDLMIEAIPALKEKYLIEAEKWKNDPVPHYLYGTIFNPYVIELIENGDHEKELKKIFEFVEKLSSSGDPRVIDVVRDTICEYVVDNNNWSAIARKYMGPITLKFSFEVEKKMNRPDSWSEELKEWLSRNSDVEEK